MGKVLYYNFQILCCLGKRRFHGSTQNHRRSAWRQCNYRRRHRRHYRAAIREYPQKHEGHCRHDCGRPQSGSYSWEWASGGCASHPERSCFGAGPAFPPQCHRRGYAGFNGLHDRAEPCECFASGRHRKGYCHGGHAGRSGPE